MWGSRRPLSPVSVFNGGFAQDLSRFSVPMDSAMGIDSLYHVALGPSLPGKIPSGDSRWHQFNGSFVNQELPQIDIASALYDGHPITTCCDPQWRKSENYQMGQHLGLDFDTEDQRSTIAMLMKDPFIKKYGSILYTTPSHTPDRPRARVLFMLDTPIRQAKNYTLAAASLLWIFGAADSQCKDPVRFFYGAKPGAAEMEWLGGELPLSLVKDLIQRYQTTGNNMRKQTQHNPIQRSSDEREVADALRYINPWSLSYDEWVAILMAIHSEFPGPGGLSLADSWADGHPGEVELKWRSFDSSGNVSGRVGLGTLFALAKDNGWERSI